MTKIVPRPTAETLPYWEGCAREVLRYQRCASCGDARFPPSASCASCGGRELKWLESRGEGAIHSVTSVARAPSKAFQHETPYIIALIDLDEGFRIMVNLRGVDRCPEIGDRVRIIFEPVSETITLPQATLPGR